jgi:hypothetical protein
MMLTENKYSGVILCQYHFVHHKSHMDLCVILITNHSIRQLR